MMLVIFKKKQKLYTLVCQNLLEETLQHRALSEVNVVAEFHILFIIMYMKISQAPCKLIDNGCSYLTVILIQRLEIYSLVMLCVVNNYCHGSQ